MSVSLIVSLPEGSNNHQIMAMEGTFCRGPGLPPRGPTTCSWTGPRSLERPGQVAAADGFFMDLLHIFLHNHGIS